MKFFPLLILLILINACSMMKSEPAWVSQRPADASYYNAVIRYSKKAPNYVAAARENALREISTQISVTIDSDIYLNETEANGVPTALLISQIKTASRNKLNDVQLMGSYENDKDYWAYYRLSKSSYRAWRMQQRDLALSQAKNLLAEFDSATSNAVSGITALLKAMELIVDFTDLDLSVNYQGKEVNLYNELFRRINNLPNILKPSLEQSNLAVVAKLRQSHSIPVSMNIDKDGVQYPCASFPLKFSFENGAGDIHTKMQTDDKGTAELMISRITDFTNPQQISVVPDKEYWMQSLENPVVKGMFGFLKFPPVMLTLQVSRPKAYIDYTFNGSLGAKYQDKLVNKLQDLELEVVKDKEISDYTFVVKVNSHEGDYVPRLKLYSSAADAYIELIDTKLEKSIYVTNKTGIKSTGTTPENAIRNSELSAVTEVSDMLLFMLVEQYIMN